MLTYDCQIRVRYYEVDSMGYLHHSRYAQYFEVARTEMLQQYYKSYREMEADGIMLPLSSLSTKFVLPARYDDVLRVRVLVKSLPSVRFLFEYEVYNQAGLLVATGDTTLVFVDATTRRPCRPPQEFMAVFSPFFDKSE